MSIFFVRINLRNFQYDIWQQEYNISYKIILPLCPLYDQFLTLLYILNN